MNCGRFEPIFWDESKLHPCEVCHGTAHFVIKSDGYFAVQCESCGSFWGEAEVPDDKTIGERIEHIAKVWNRGFLYALATNLKEN